MSDDPDESEESLPESGAERRPHSHLIDPMGTYDLWMGFFKDSDANVLNLMSGDPYDYL
jgi:hypothetical protein